MKVFFKFILQLPQQTPFMENRHKMKIQSNRWKISTFIIYFCMYSGPGTEFGNWKALNVFPFNSITTEGMNFIEWWRKHTYFRISVQLSICYNSFLFSWEIEYRDGGTYRNGNDEQIRHEWHRDEAIQSSIRMRMKS